jgi:D-3-phosphoglycerate dehydrogenase
MKVLITGRVHENSLKKLIENGVQCEYKPGLTGVGLDEHLPDTEVLVIRTETKISPELLDRCPQLKLICRVGVGVDHIDLNACTLKKINVINTPKGNRISTAEHTIGLLFTLAKKIAFSHIDMKDGRWLRDTATGVEIMDKTLLIIGLGNIGSEVAKRAKALGMKVIAVDPYQHSNKLILLLFMCL